MSNETELLERIMHLGGLDARRDAGRALKATLAALGERLDEDARGALARALPEKLGAMLHRKHRGAFDVAEFYDRVRKREGVSLGFAREHAQVVCRVLGERLPAAKLRELDEGLPESFAALFHPPRQAEPPPEHRLPHGERRHTLATGRPGATHPLSDSAPPGAQSHSVVREANPHADTKLSSAPGMTQERLDDSLATAHPDGQRTIAKASE
jgi:uncharacterized protein (DUF2267 family)